MQHPPATILLVDDIAENLRLLAEMLQRANYSPRPVLSGANALKLLERQSVDLILLDINMPEMDGYEVCERLKRNPKLKHIPVIFLSAAQDTTAKVRGVRRCGLHHEALSVRGSSSSSRDPSSNPTAANCRAAAARSHPRRHGSTARRLSPSRLATSVWAICSTQTVHGLRGLPSASQRAMDVPPRRLHGLYRVLSASRSPRGAGLHSRRPRLYRPSALRTAL